MAFLYGTVLLAFALVLCVFLFFFVRSLGINLLSGLGILVLSFLLDFPVILIIVISLLVILTSWKYMRAMGVLSVLLVFLVLASSILAQGGPPPNPGPNASLVERVRTVEQVLMVTNQPEMNLKGTDYLVGDEGKLMVFVTQGGYPILNASCFISVLYPNMTFFITNTLMLPAAQPFFEGLYYYDFIVPNVTGVYPVNANCFFNTTTISETPIGLQNNITLLTGSIPDLKGADGFQKMQYEGGLFLDGFTLTKLYELENATKYTNGMNIQDPDPAFTGPQYNATTNLSDGISATSVSIGDIGSGISAGQITVLLNMDFDETSGTTIDDTSSLNNDGTAFGSPDLTVTGISNTGIDFDGIDDYIEIPDNPGYDLNSTEELIVCFTIKTDGDIPKNDYVMDFKDGGGGNGWEIRGENDKLRFTTQRAAGGSKNHDSVFQFDDFNFHTYCGYQNSTNMVSYVDGSLDRITAQAQTGAMTTSEVKRIGTDTLTTDFTEETIDEFCMGKGQNINISQVASIYNISNDCAAALGGQPTSMIKTQFNVSFNNSFAYYLGFETSDSGVTYTIHPYQTSNTIYLNETTLSITGATSFYEVEVTDLLALIDSNSTTTTSDFRIYPDAETTINEVTLRQTLTNYSGVTDCTGKNCEITHEFALPLGYNNSFLTDRRVIINTRTTASRNFIYSIYNYTSGQYEPFYTLAGPKYNYQNAQKTFNEHHYNGSNVRVKVNVTDFRQNTYLDLEQLTLTRTYNGTSLIDLRGNEELVVSQGLQNISNEVFSDEPIIDSTSLVCILLILGVITFAFLQMWVFAAFLLILFVIICNPNLWVNVTLLMISVLMLIKGWHK